MSFPRQSARTQRFTLGVPRGFQIAPDGSRVVFLRTRGGTDPVTCLWTLDVASGAERLIVDPRALDLPGEEDLPPEERARRERHREQAGGIVAFATDKEVRVAAFALSGRLFVTDLRDGGVRALPSATPVVDPRPDPSGRLVAYASGRALRLIDIDSGDDRALAEPEGDDITYGLAEFIAAEEMNRFHGYWWAPDGRALLTTRVDESPVKRWYIPDPANPDHPATEVAYPAAGTPNADVTLAIIDLAGRRVDVDWDRAAFPYLVTARWDDSPLIAGAEPEEPGARAGRDELCVVVQSRDQKTMRILAVAPENGATRLVREDTDPIWLEIVTGVPAWTMRGDLVWTVDRDDARRLLVGDKIVTPPELQVRSVLDVDHNAAGDTILFTASTEPTEVHLWTYGPDGLNQLSTGRGVFTGRRAGGTTVVTGSSLERYGVIARVLFGDRLVEIDSLAETPVITPKVELIRAGAREVRTAVVLPSWYDPGSGPLPVLMDPYGGPHAQRVLAVQRIFCEPQWLADQGFAVVIADGRGTPGRGATWERAIHADVAEPVLEDQVAALLAAAERFPLDLGRVAIRGWSFGGYLAALAVLRRPEVFHAAVAGAPVADWTLYDTHYTERYLGHPAEEPENYERCSLFASIADAHLRHEPDAHLRHEPDAHLRHEPDAHLRHDTKIERPLLLIHGLADDNVVAAHTLRLSSALLAAGHTHSVLPLSGVTHMTPQEVVAENLLLLQVDFLKRALAEGSGVTS